MNIIGKSFLALSIAAVTSCTSLVKTFETGVAYDTREICKSRDKRTLLFDCDTGAWFSFFNEYRARTRNDQHFVEFVDLKDAERFFKAGYSMWKKDSFILIKSKKASYYASYGPKCITFEMYDPVEINDRVCFSIGYFQYDRILWCLNNRLNPPPQK